MISLMRRTISVLGIAGFVLATNAATAATNRPNIILVMTDDQGWGAGRLPRPSVDENTEPRCDGRERVASGPVLRRRTELFADASRGVDRKK